MKSKDYKIAITCDCFGKHPFGGPGVRMYNIVSMLRKFNIDYTLFSSNDNIHPDYSVKNRRNTKDFDAKEFDIYWIEQGFSMIKILNEMDIYPIIGSNIIPNSAPQHCLPYLDEVGRERQDAYIQNEKKIIGEIKGKFWLSQSDFQEKEYRKLGLNFDIPVYRAANPINVRKFYPVKYPNSNFVIGWTGKNNWAKHPGFLREIAECFPEIIFYYFSDEKTNLDLGKNVELILGNTNAQMPKLLQKCNIFISTSVTENQPLGVLEAMATGIPVVAFRTSGIPEIITEDINGVLVDLGNVEHFIVQLKRLIINKNMRNELGKNARKYIIENFSEEACIKKYIKIFDHYIEE